MRKHKISKVEYLLLYVINETDFYLNSISLSVSIKI